MKNKLLFFLMLLSMNVFSQEEASKWQLHLGLGQYPASIIVPNFKPIHPGIQAGFNYQWNSNPKHQFQQSANLAYFYHKDLQHAIQLFTELSYQINLKKLRITPFAIGGGYVFSVLDLTTLEWNEDNQVYEVDNFAVRNNWLISLGAGLGLNTGMTILDRPLTFTLDYRIQVQGVLIRETSPIIGYAPIQIGITLPLQKQSTLENN